MDHPKALAAMAHSSTSIELDRQKCFEQLIAAIEAKLLQEGSLLQAFVRHLLEDDDILGPFLEVAIDTLNERGGVCCYDWHRSEADFTLPGTCGSCGKSKDEHDLILCCRRRNLEELVEPEAG